MPRIRTIKPEFWSDEKLSELVAIDRLVFLGLIGMADDYGRLHDNVKVIDAFIFPNSSETVRESVANLSRIGRIRRGNCSNGAKVIEIVNWSKHQRVDKPQNHLALPPIVRTIEGTPGNIAIPESFANHSGIIPEKVATLPGTVGPRAAPNLPAGPPVPPVEPIADPNGKSEPLATPARRKKKAKFEIPTITEVVEYCEAEAFKIDPEEFWEHYQAQGWILGNGRAMQDWKLACRKWNRKETKPPAGTNNGYHLTEAQKRLQNSERASQEWVANTDNAIFQLGDK